MLDAVVPAGGLISPNYAARIGTPWRALAPIGPERVPVMQRVVDALHDSGYIESIVGVAPPAVQEKIVGVSKWLPSGDSGPANIRTGLAILPNAESGAVVCTSDLPLITGAHVREFLECTDADADVSIGVTSKRAYEAAFPGSPMSAFAPFRDVGPVTMACLFRVRPALLTRNAALLERAFGARKSQVSMAALLGPSLLARFVLRRLTLAAVQVRAETFLHGRADVLFDCPPALAFDIDNADDYAYAAAFEAPAGNTTAAHGPAGDGG